jgi:NitT/TauT family transport system permease protein
MKSELTLDSKPQAAWNTRSLRLSPRLTHVAWAIALPILFLVLLAVAWQIMASTLKNPLIPNVAEVGHELGVIFGDGSFFVQMGITIKRVALGFLLAFALALIAGIAIGRSQRIRQFMEPAILIGLTVPGLVWALLCVIWFGISLSSSTVAVALSITPALILNMAQGVKSVNADLVEMSGVFQLSAWARLRFLWLPTLYPFLLSGVRLGLSLAWKVIVLVEVFGLSSGVGYQLNVQFSSQNVASVLAWTIGFAAVMALIEYGVIGTLEKRASRWRRVASI